jgi:hypothetical protein
VNKSVWNIIKRVLVFSTYLNKSLGLNITAVSVSK